MPDQSTPPGGQQAGSPIPVSFGMTGQEIYDGIMATIEPDLVTTARATLDAKYRGETPEQRKTRLDRYNTAFEEYERRYARFIEDLHAQSAAQLKRAREAFERSSRERESAQLSSIEAAISTT